MQFISNLWHNQKQKKNIEDQMFFVILNAFSNGMCHVASFHLSKMHLKQNPFHLTQWLLLGIVSKKYLRTKVRGDFNIHGTRNFYVAVFHQKSKNYDVVSLHLPLVGQKTHPLHEMLTRLVITENAF